MHSSFFSSPLWEACNEQHILPKRTYIFYSFARRRNIIYIKHFVRKPWNSLRKLFLSWADAENLLIRTEGVYTTNLMCSMWGLSSYRIECFVELLSFCSYNCGKSLCEWASCGLHTFLFFIKNSKCDVDTENEKKIYKTNIS